MLPFSSYEKDTPAAEALLFNAFLSKAK
jgi:hypothetical protein